MHVGCADELEQGCEGSSGPGVVLGGCRRLLGLSMSISRSAITKHCRLSGLSSGDLFLTILETEKSKVKVPAALILVRALFLACRQPSSCSVLMWTFL